MNAQKSLSSISANRSLWIAQYRQEIFERDRISGLSAAQRKGEKEGRLALAKKFMSMEHTAEEPADHKSHPRQQHEGSVR